ncbi:MFS family permease [Neorhizobium huautlense]|uniref:MFS family permease n=1 Tax=Neorhizobium huautlense TaxID=67774 RepID=A0ABT9PLU2_9HYPH|nr:MFS transporter [Neorhizobium huautlense]MDP9835433.1 MFS family permease [Neorhizobium huautlense]
MSPRETAARLSAEATTNDVPARMEAGEAKEETELASQAEKPAALSVSGPASSAAPSPAAPPPFIPKPPLIALGYMLASTIVALTQGLGLSFLTVNLQQVAGPLGVTTNEAAWLMAAYVFPNASLGLFLFKIRMQYGIRNFAEIAIVIYVLVSIAHLWANDFSSAMILRFFAGAAAAPLSSLAFLYMIEVFPPQQKLSIGQALALTAIALPTPVAGLLSPGLFDLGDWSTLNMLELGLSLISLAFIYLLPLTSPPRMKVMQWMDYVSFTFLAICMGCFAAALTLGRLYWWTEAPWLGWMMAVGVASGMICAIIELNRRNHLIDIRWITSKEIIHFAGILLLFRILLSEQSSGAINMFRQLGLLNDQLQGLYWVILVGSLGAGAFCAWLSRPGRAEIIHAISLLLLAIGSYMDSQSTVLTRPEQMYFSQFLVSFAMGLFLPPAMAVGFAAALQRGLVYILSFLAVFLATQKVGGYLGSALFGSFVTWREQFHSFRIISRLNPTDPMLTARLQQYGAAFARVTQDGNLRSIQGASQLSKLIQQQAYVLAYNDAFLLTSLMSLAALGCLCLHMAWRHRHALFKPREAKTPVAVNS